MAHVWVTVILSIPALLYSFDYPDENHHVGLHGARLVDDPFEQSAHRLVAERATSFSRSAG